MFSRCFKIHSECIDVVLIPNPKLLLLNPENRIRSELFVCLGCRLRLRLLKPGHGLSQVEERKQTAHGLALQLDNWQRHS